MSNTFGPAYDPDLDADRVSQQLDRIRDLMVDGEWRTLGEIAEQTNDPESSVSAQLRHLRKPKFGAYIVEKRRRGAPKNGLWEYRIAGKNPDPSPPKKRNLFPRLGPKPSPQVMMAARANLVVLYKADKLSPALIEVLAWLKPLITK